MFSEMYINVELFLFHEMWVIMVIFFLSLQTLFSVYII